MQKDRRTDNYEKPKGKYWNSKLFVLPIVHEMNFLLIFESCQSFTNKVFHINDKERAEAMCSNQY